MRLTPTLLSTSIILILSLFISSCSNFSEGKPKAEQALAEFYRNYNSPNFELIYDQAHEDFKKSTPRKEFLDFMMVVRQKLGEETESKNVGWKVNTHNLKTYVSLTQETTFQEGQAKESFLFRIQDEKAYLLNYNINSKDLIMK
ncbi:hypothetical protein [Desulfogranum japonicum]|uniref:hypothetical protein n=1 Tax=Desulfogranum japonicum TaxID=231447 RepID=UPI00041EC09E|nr:hypothetical protein [Desulfogranum japonicum]